MVNYWQNQVLPNHLPPIDIRKRQEIFLLKQSTLTQEPGQKLEMHKNSAIGNIDDRKRAHTRLTLEEMADSKGSRNRIRI